MEHLSAAPALSTPAEHIFDYEPGGTSSTGPELEDRPQDELRETYEISRTAREIREAGHKRIALQFPDAMLCHAPWVAEALKSELATLEATSSPTTTSTQPPRIYILADTSYSSCCVDEIAAEHAQADVVVHYGRSCLSPTSRLPVIHVFTRRPLDEDAALEAFEKTFDKNSRVVLMADVGYHGHVAPLAEHIRSRGYDRLLSTDLCHDPLGRIPNRVIRDAAGHEVSCCSDNGDSDDSRIHLSDYAVFHLATPPTALLLALSSRVDSLHVLPAETPSTADDSPARTARRLLGRRYARVLSLATAGVVGILVNTLSVAGFLPSVDALRARIAAAGKKSYTVVVGKLNPAKLANFAEIDGWVVVGCWESSLVEEDGGGSNAFFRPVVTPFELDLALAGDDARVWTGEWWGGTEGLARAAGAQKERGAEQPIERDSGNGQEDELDEDESEPPEFDLRTGKLVSRSRPMRTAGARGAGGGDSGETESTTALAMRPRSELATVNGVASPGAEFLRSQRTWQGLGSDFDVEASTAIEEGRSGVARGYTVGRDDERR